MHHQHHLEDRRVAKLTHIQTDSDLEEAIQIVNYKPGQWYRAHYDYFAKELYQNEK